MRLLSVFIGISKFSTITNQFGDTLKHGSDELVPGWRLFLCNTTLRLFLDEPTNVQINWLIQQISSQLPDSMIAQATKPHTGDLIKILLGKSIIINIRFGGQSYSWPACGRWRWRRRRGQTFLGSGRVERTCLAWRAVFLSLLAW